MVPVFCVPLQTNMAEDKKNKQIITHGHPYVEIDGVKWATMNVGAKDVADSGLYFAWGETKGYKPEDVENEVKLFRSDEYKFGRFVKYNEEDKLIVLQPQNDPVKVNWRGNWRLPTQEEFLHLTSKEGWGYVENYRGMRGNLLVTDNSQELFFPFAGYLYDGEFGNFPVGGYYWASSVCNDYNGYAYNAYFSQQSRGVGSNARYIGFPVRGVLGD